MAKRERGDYDLSTVGGRIKAARDLAGLSQDGLVMHLRDLGYRVSRATVTGYEQGARRNPQRDKLEALAEALGVGTDWLMTGEGRPPAGVASGLPEWDAFVTGRRGRTLTPDERKALYSLACHTVHGQHVTERILVAVLALIREEMSAEEAAEQVPEHVSYVVLQDWKRPPPNDD